MKEVKSRKQINDSWYKVALIAIGIIIIGLVVCIIIVSSNRDNNDDDYDAYWTEVSFELAPEDKVAEEASNMLSDAADNFDEIESYYDGVIDKAEGDGDYFFAAKIVEQKILFILTKEYDCERAQAYLDGHDFSHYPEDVLPYLWSNIDSAMWECENMEEDDA